ncbi:MAG: methylated-DNA--[protein]-cysteine S-methyltransferase [Xylanivirga thermophila]|jgi:methylated-DNA-[protein]-cysteine S-methyltransferase|uniref:methylated-DNA--[protein]-cysteine S-methyltransferase n=1 Tax=Xylanivirga thermophila TaxID=2496273 RepID=UPI00101D55A8|nr:methylated-DNA--[protein]-cysteine S-methyltransferase [Xylanivirga thermophila]
MNNFYTFSYINSPIGIIFIKSTPAGVCQIDIGYNLNKDISIVCTKDSPVSIQLMEYFQGIRKNFNIKVDIKGTPFQMKVWKALSSIPYGSTKTYKDIAIEIGSPKGYRAVAQACSKNPVPIIIPCHRVVGSNGRLGGYSGGGGIKSKTYLLTLEKSGGQIV